MSQDLINQFVAQLQKDNKSKSTVIAYEKDLSQLLEYTQKDLAQLTTAEIQAAIENMKQDQSFSNKTLSRKLNSFRTFYKHLEAQGKVASNPAMAIDHPKLEPKQQRVLSQMEFLALRESTKDNPRLHAMIELMLQTGIRIGEISRLTIGDIVFNGQTSKLYIAEYSTNPAREVPLNNKALNCLRNYIDSQPNNSGKSALFATREGNHIIIRNIRSAVDRSMIKAGIENACVNDLRNTFIVEQLKAGVALDLIAQVVGHRSKTTTQKYVELLSDPYRPSGLSKIVEI